MEMGTGLGSLGSLEEAYIDATAQCIHLQSQRPNGYGG